MRKTLFIVLLAAGLASLAGCATAREALPETQPLVGSAPMDASVEEQFARAPEAEAPVEPAGGAETDAVQTLVIRNASLTLVVEDPAVSVEEIRALAQEMGGFVVFSNVRQTAYGANEKTTEASLTIRVPAEKLDEALEEIKAGAVEVRNENVRGEDVTQEYTDLQAQLRNLEAAEAQLREIMASATKTEDVLRVFQDLRQVRQEIEVTKGRINYLEESARLSAIEIQLIPDVLAQPLQIGRWTPVGTARQALEALIRALQFIVDLGIWVAICILPVGLLLGFPGYLAVRAGLRRWRAREEEQGSAD